jgi:hypothetical protein
MTTKPEQRRAARKPLQSSGVLTMSGIPCDVKTFDVAAGGLCVFAAKQLAVGKSCHVNFGVPGVGGMQTVAVSADVIYCFFRGDDGYKIGLQFREVFADGPQVIAAYIAG